ncbi:MAG TPA: hypothetical protein VL263_23120 [Vicinamibacterales bacterium]|nr:hypothetical protein [Vicinamibacterales bacterium]
MTSRLPVASAATLAGTIVAAYLMAITGAAIVPGLAAAIGLLAGLVLQRSIRLGDPRPAAMTVTVWCGLVAAGLVLLMRLTWPALLPPGGASDLTHHLMLVDVLERSRHLVDGASEAALGEMAHYTPGLHLLIVVAGALAGIDAYRVVYPVLAVTVALKAGVVVLIAAELLNGSRSRVPIALAAVGLVLFAPMAYSVDGFLRAGFLAQVASELFVVAGWWGLANWWSSRAPAWMAFTGLMGAATFLTWPIWVGPLVVAAAVSLLSARELSSTARVRAAVFGFGPVAVVAVLHLSAHAAWLGLAGTSGAVPLLAPGPLGWLFIALACAGAVIGWRQPPARPTLWFAAALVAQALALYALARMRGAETPYMAMKMLYLGVYPAAVLGILGIDAIARRFPSGVSWAVLLVVCGIGVGHARSTVVPPPVVDVSLHDAGKWAREHLEARCVDYIVENADQAYWLHLAVLGQPRSSPRTADIDHYTANRAAGRWVEGGALPYAVAFRALLPGEVVRDAKVLKEVGDAVVIERVGVACPSAIGD